MEKSGKRIFVTNFSFLTDSTPLPHPPYPLNIKSPLSVTKVFCQCLLRLKKYFTLSHEMIEFNEFSVSLIESNSPNNSLATGSKSYYFTQMHNPNIKINSVHPSSFCRGGDWAPNHIFTKGDLGKTSTFGGGCWKTGVKFFRGRVLELSHKNKLKSEIFTDKKSWSACIVCWFKRLGKK